MKLGLGKDKKKVSGWVWVGVKGCISVQKHLRSPQVWKGWPNHVKWKCSG